MFSKDKGHIVTKAASSQEYTTDKGFLGTGGVPVLNPNTHKNLGTRESRQDKGNINTSYRELTGYEKSCPYSESQQGVITLGNLSKLSVRSTARVF